MTHINTRKTTEQLCVVFGEWCDTNGLPQESAEELQWHDDCTDEQRIELQVFIDTWNEVQELEDAQLRDA